MIRAIKNFGGAFARLGKNLGSAGYVFGRSIGRSVLRFIVEIKCAFVGCNGTDGSCCR